MSNDGQVNQTLALVTMHQIFQGLCLGWGQLRSQSSEDLAFCLWTYLGDDFVNGTFRRNATESVKLLRYFLDVPTSTRY